MTKTLFQHLCPKCNRSFSSRGSKNKTSDRHPLIINCGHTICKGCIVSAGKVEKFIICTVCERRTELAEGEGSADGFLSDVYVVGKLIAKDQNLNLKINDPSKNSDSKIQSNAESITAVFCDECNKLPAVWRCDKCGANYCNVCYDTVHKVSKVMKKHEGKPIFVESYRSKVQEGCPKHDQRPIEFYCEDDGQLACSYCVVLGDHKEHSVITLADKNRSCSEALKVGIEEGRKVQSRLYSVEKRLTKILPDVDNDVSELSQNVCTQFHRLHSLLQLRETEILSHLAQVSHQNVNKLENMRQIISDHHKELTSVLKDAEQALTNNQLTINLVDVVKKLHSVKELPCYLVPVPSDDKNEVKVHFDSDFEDAVKRYGKIEVNMKPKYVLKTESELPPGYETDIEDDITTDTESVTSRTESFSEDLPTPDDNNITGASYDKALHFTTMKQEKVQVTHIQSLSRFWVQKTSDLHKIRTMTDSINKWCFSPESLKHIPTSLKLGELYLVLFQVDHNWYRARVKKIFNPSKETSSENETVPESFSQQSNSSEIAAQVMYIDYGNTDAVPISNIRKMQSRFLHLSGLAMECALWDILPANNTTEWSDQALKAFASFVNSRELLMIVVENRNDILYVDLCHPGNTAVGIKNDIPVSVRDALVFMEVGCLATGGRSPLQKSNVKGYLNKTKLREFIPPEPLVLGQRLNVLLSHVNSPHHFYVQQMGSNARYLSNLIFQMQEKYDSAKNDSTSIFVPKVGMICVCQYSLDKQWYRAQIVKLAGGGNVEVFYVDFGNSEIVSYKRLRKILDEFTKLPCQAIKCSLVDVGPGNDTEWSLESKEWFTEEAGKKELSLSVHRIVPGEGTAQVILYHIKENVEVCINGLIVKEGLARSTGSESTILEVPRYSRAARKSTHNESAMTEKHFKSHSVKNKQAFPTALIKTREEKSFILKQEEDARKKGYIAIHVNHIESPDCFYVLLVSQKEEREKMINGMQEIYNQSETKEIDICENEFYAVLHPKDKKWYRGQVVKIVDDSVEVLFVDFGFSCSITKDKMQILLPHIREIKIFAVKCYLVGIIPAGGSKWSNMACETLKSLALPTETLYLQKKNESTNNNSCAVDIHIKEVHSGALEMTSVEYKSITKMLLEKGVAIPSERMRSSPSSSSVNKSSSVTEQTVKNSNKFSLEEVKDDSSFIPVPKVVTKSVSSPSVSSSTSSSPSSLTTVKTERDTNYKNTKYAKLNFTWKPAVLTKKEFECIPTHVGNDGCIYLHSTEEASNKLRIIKNALKVKYNRHDVVPLREYPAVGQTCIAKFCIDDGWYRAKVTKIEPPKIEVLFVDYGNTEIVTLKDIHLDIILMDIPCQCFECELYGIEPNTEDGIWSTNTLDFIHNTIVETKCTVTVMEELDSGNRLPIKLELPENMNLASLLIDINEARERLDDDIESCPGKGKSLSEETMSKSLVHSIVSPFEMPILPENGVLFPIVVTQMCHSNILYIQRLQIDEPTEHWERMVNEDYSRFLSMMSELSEKAEGFCRLETVQMGMACCGMYTYDDHWYRCVVTGEVEEGILVSYIDYGNCEVIPTKRLRELPIEYFLLSYQAILCKLRGIEPVGGKWTDDIVSGMMKALLSEGGKLFAQLHGNRSQAEPNEIDVFIQRSKGGKLELAYQELIDNGLLQRQDNSEEC